MSLREGTPDAAPTGLGPIGRAAIPWLGAMGYRTSPLRGWTERSGSTPSHGWRHGLQDVARFAGFMTNFPIVRVEPPVGRL